MLYYIHIPLPKDLRDRVAAVELKYQAKGSKSEPHITLIPPRKLMEGRLENYLKGTIDLMAERYQQHPFWIDQNGLGYFGKKETVYINIYRSSPLLRLHENLVNVISGILEPADGPYNNLPTPHITLAKNLSPERGEEAWQELSRQDFIGRFMCYQIELLRQGPADKRWQVIGQFQV